MRQVVAYQYGPPEVLSVVHQADPVPASNEVLVQVAAAGVNYLDIYQRTGAYSVRFPWTPGVEGSGTVLSVGEAVSEFKPGDRVAWAGCPGSYASHRALPADRLVPVRSALSLEDAAAVLTQGMTAHFLATDVAPVGANSVCLVHAAVGGVGGLLCQLARLRGATVIGTVSRPQKLAAARANGAAHVIDYSRGEFAKRVMEITQGRGVDVVYDAVGKDTFAEGLDCLRPRGTFVLYGQTSGRVPSVDPQDLNGKGSLFFTKASLSHYDRTRAQLLDRADIVMRHLEQGELRPRLQGKYRLEEAAEAHAVLESRMAIGKLLICPLPETLPSPVRSGGAWPGTYVKELWMLDVAPWPARLAETYRENCWRGRPLGACMWDWADQWRDMVALVSGDLRLTYGELAASVDRLAEQLAGLGLGHHDKILVQLPNCAEFVIVTLACFRLGVVPVMMLPQHREYELTAIGAHVRARALVVPSQWHGYDHQDLAHRVAAALPEPAHVLVVGPAVQGSHDLRAWLAPRGQDQARRQRLDAHAPAPDEAALFLLSGGTTGLPKVISRTHDDYEYNIRQCARACRFGPDTVYLAALPAGHNFALGSPGILGALMSGGRVVLTPSPRPALVFDAIEAEGVTDTSAVPAVVLQWMAEAPRSARGLSSLRCVQVGGAMLSPDLAARIGPALGCRLQQVYGMAEGLICYTAPDAPPEVAYQTQGRPVSSYDELLVVGPDGYPVRPGEVGELLTRGPYTLRAYVGEPSSAACTPDGWYRTGDLVRVTPAGNVVVCGRVKDLINRAGEKISAAEVENLAQGLPEVAEAAAIPDLDPEKGERVCLVVRLRPGCQLSLEAVRADFTRRGVAAFKLPERLVVLDELPHTAIGKADKKALRSSLTSSTPKDR
jgi:2,3-dihydroxybenzoate-AMP ligase